MKADIAPGVNRDEVVIELSETQSRDVVDAPRRTQNFYHSKKSAAEGMMDISLLTANANQLKFILYFNQSSKTFFPALGLIVLSLVLQVSVGILLIFRVSFVCSFDISSLNRRIVSASLQEQRPETTSQHSQRISRAADFPGDSHKHYGRSSNHNRSLERVRRQIKAAYQQNGVDSFRVIFTFIAFSHTRRRRSFKLN